VEAIEGAEPVETAATRRPGNQQKELGRMVKVPVRTWRPSADVIRDLDLSSEQLERIQANEAAYAAAMQEARAIEQKRTIRLIRSLGRDPLDLGIVEDRRARLDVATLDRLRIAVDRVENLREILGLERYRRLVDLDPSAVRIGSFQPYPVLQVKVEDYPTPGSEETAPPAELPTDTDTQQE